MLRVGVSEYVLEIVEGPEAGRQIPLAQQSIEIGRQAEAGIEIASDTLISRQHARLTPTANGIIVEDLGSSNGTFVDGDEIHSPAVLTPGSNLTIGVTVLQLRTAAQASDGTVIRPVPTGLTSLRMTRVAPAAEAHAVPAGGLAVEERRPDYVPPEVSGSRGGDSPLNPLLDVHTKRMARTAPLAIFVLVVLVVVIALALR